ncbi:MAG: TIM barrel protein [Candidatus Poribacteria bacterium]|nr:TIM barrel protein [Candidatus Poribacteria bacterium]
MKVGIQTGMNDPKKLAAYCHELNVDQVCLGDAVFTAGDAPTAPGDVEKLMASKAALAEQSVDLSVIYTHAFRHCERNTAAPDWLRQLEGRKDLESVLQMIECVGEASIPAVLFYTYMERPASKADEPDAWKSLMDFYAAVAEGAEKSNVKIATHGHFHPDYLIWNFESIQRLLEDVPNPYNGVTYDAGILALADSDPYSAVAPLSDRIHFAHARDVVGNWEGFEEVFLDEGEIDYPRVLRLVEETGFDGVICPEHLGPAKPGENIEALAVAYLQQHLREP